MVCLCLLLKGCDDRPWNNPYPYEPPEANALYTAFSDRPKHLDPARSYTAPEWEVICQIYEPPLQYHYLKRPYEMVPLTASDLPKVRYYNQKGEILADNADSNLIAYTDYIISIKPNIFYQNHPAFAKNKKGNYLYHHLNTEEANQYHILNDFKEQSTREVTAEDYIYQIKRLAEPHLASPIFGLMAKYIEGLKELRETLIAKTNENNSNTDSNIEMDLRSYGLAGVELIDRYTFRIRIKGKYTQFRYWLAMPFFSPIPWEVAKFYAQPDLKARNISLDWYPVGTGPFVLAENNPDRQMILQKNPNFRLELYPTEGTSQDKAAGLLVNSGKRLPLIDKIIFTLEKEDIPYWNKFLQGYYDTSGISSDNFGSSIGLTPTGGMDVSNPLKEQGIYLRSSVAPSIWYWGFNMLDETVGGYSEKAKKLRQAISLAFDVQEYINIFLNGRGVLAAGPIPPGIFGYEVQPKVSTTDIAKAKSLLKEIGIDNNLAIYFDTVDTGNPDEIESLAWLKKQFSKIGIQLVIRGTDFNRFQEKLHLGNVQMYFAGWNADYPDPENLLFLLYGPNASANIGGENTANYNNPAYNKLFEKMRTMDNTPERLNIIKEMISILQDDAPWVWGFNPKSFSLSHEWIKARKPSGVINNTLKYVSVDPGLRAKQRIHWNQPIIWPFWLALVSLLIILAPAVYQYWKKEHIPLERL